VQNLSDVIRSINTTDSKQNFFMRKFIIEKHSVQQLAYLNYQMRPKYILASYYTLAAPRQNA
jgi:hypothetical protein